MNDTSANASRARLALITAMLIYGTIGIFRKYIPLPSSMIALVRGSVGMVFLLLWTICRGNRPSLRAIRANLLPLLISGTFLGANWILLFEAYNYTTVATATLCYYMAPVFIILASCVVFRERLTKKKAVCVLMALIGMIFVSGVGQSGLSKGTASQLTGVLLALAAAVLYALIVLINKWISNITAYDKTIVQLGISAIVVLPYVLLTEDMSALTLTPVILFLLLFVGIVHTGIAYALYFGSLKELPAQTSALFSYIDPTVAILLSTFLLKEEMSPVKLLGAVLVLGATMASELSLPVKPRDREGRTA